MSVKKTTYLELIAALREVPGIMYLDKDFGQIEGVGPGSGPVFPMPAIFISFGNAPRQHISGGLVQAQQTIRFRVCYENYADSFEGSQDQESAIAYFDFMEDVMQALTGLSGTHFTSLQPVNDEEDVEHKNYIVTILQFGTVLTDESTTTAGRGTTKDITLSDAKLTVERKDELTEPDVNFITDFLTPT
jgi:hypothetical protein